MLLHLVYTIVVFILLWLYVQYIVNPAPFDQMVKWLMMAVGGIVAIVVIAQIWGIGFPG